MADEVYRPIVSDEDDQSETPPASAELEIKDFRSRVEEGVDRSDYLTSKRELRSAGADQTRTQRRPARSFPFNGWNT